jgi:tripartite-type tricarboxylate transporter receptor subunit TctC
MLQIYPAGRATRFALAVILTALLSVFSSAASAQSWPAKPVTIVVPFPAGGSTDVVGRLLSKELSRMWNQSVVVDNKVGAGGNIGATAVAKSAPDGYTLLLASGSIMTVNPHIYVKLPFDPKKDFLPITNVSAGPMVVVVPPNARVSDLKGLVDQARSNPGKLNFGSAGTGSQVHMATEKLANAAAITIQHVPYKGEGPAYTDLSSSLTDLMVGNIAAAAPLVNDGRLKALAVTSRERSKLLPNVPTVIEAGFPDAENYGWFGLLAPAGTPKEVIEKVQRDVTKVLAEADIKTRLAGFGMVPVGNTPAEFARAIDQETQQWGVVVKNRGLQAQ